MIYLRRLLTLLTPSPVAGCVSIVAALAFGYLLSAELEPAPQCITTVDIPFERPDGLFVSYEAVFSPDGKSIVYHFAQRDDPDPTKSPRHATHLHHLLTNKQLILSDKTAPAIVFDPDGKYIAGIWQGTVCVWDRETGAEQKRFIVKLTDFEPWLAFTPEGLVLWNNWNLDENEKVEKRLTVLGENKPWQGRKQDFDRWYDEQQTIPLRSVVSADGNYTLNPGKSGFVVTDARGKPGKPINFSSDFEVTGNAGISPDGKTLIVPGRSWLPLRSAYAWVAWVYSATKNPTATDGVRLVDSDSGAEIVFIHRRGEFGVTPDGKCFTLMERSNTHPGSITLTIYDWPLARPWWKICGGALLAFVTLLLIGKAWRWYRGTRKSEEEFAPLTKPPWETEAGALDSSNEIQ